MFSGKIFAFTVISALYQVDNKISHQENEKEENVNLENVIKAKPYK